MNKKLFKYIGFIVCTPVIFNFVINLIYNNVDISINFSEFVSSLFLFIFLFSFGASFKNATSNQFTYTTGIVTYLISFFLFETIGLIFVQQLNIHIVFNFVNIAWIIYFVFFLKSKSYLIFNSLSFAFLYLYNLYNSKNFQFNKNIEGDVKDVFFLNTEKIFNESLFLSISEPLMQGYPQFMSYIDAILYKLSSDSDQYQYMIQTSFVFFWLFCLLFFELDLRIDNKIFIIVFFTCLVLNSNWLEFLFLSSLMSERIASYLFLSLLLNLHKCKQMNNIAFIFSLILFSFVYITKQFFSLILLFIFVYLLFNKQTRKLSPFLLFAYILREITHLTYFQGVPKDHHISQINLIDTFFDLILLRNLKFENIKFILQNLFMDIPSSYLFILFIVSSISFLLIAKNLNNINTIFIATTFLNIVFVFLLYISVWQNMELESPIRYLYSFIPIQIVSIFLNIEYFYKKYYSVQ